MLWEQSEICVSAKALLEKIDPADLEGLTRNSLSPQIWKNLGALRNSGIVVSFRRWSRGRLICLKSFDGVDDLATEKIVTIDPYEYFAGCGVHSSGREKPPIWEGKPRVRGYTPAAVSGPCPAPSPFVDTSSLSFAPPRAAGRIHYAVSPLQTKPASLDFRLVGAKG